jgi:RHS repeat-associated protein
MGYDPMGRRTTLSKGSQNKTFFYLGQSLLSDGTSKFLHGSGIDQPLQLDGNSGSLSYLSDHLGSTSQLLDGNGTRKARYDYQSYGQLEGNSSNPLASNPFTYTAREDDGTGLLYYRARYYDPELEVFISQDPLGDAQRYVSGNPLGFVDPSGLQDENTQQNIQSSAAFFGTSTVNDALVRKSYVSDISKLSTIEGYSPARDALRVYYQNQTSAIGKATISSLYSASAKLNAGKASPFFNQIAANSGRAGGILTAIAVAQSAHNIAVAPNDLRACVVAREGGLWAGALSFGSLGVQAGAGVGAFFGGVGVLPGAIIGGLAGSVYGGMAGSKASVQLYYWVNER